ncbi:protein of unknown function DUF820 [Alloactinosynnema sp. L-07]|uniref:Uma2 family endonuclease n=1 Tax=Alloactinosynnema sp. L-07 TaxID=1653480 RepID=UPI00065EF863|nr:Uma2 family endonuclease [Alloactinosynnema sp. L-07]CRK61262.1 protein of unknown function DUF820 [Alloactinosynnema sp. L-07]
MTSAGKHATIGPLTVDDWLAADPPIDGSRLELIVGHLHVTPARSGEHQTAAYRIARMVDDALAAPGRHGLCVVPAVAVRISTAWRTALIPDVVVLTKKPIGVSFGADEVALVVEIWSPANRRVERETKFAAYAAAEVPFLWTLDLGDEFRCPVLTAYRWDKGQYIEENVVKPVGTITAAPVPVKLDLADLS